ncbi:hypothetical protein IL992_43490 [Microbispora sp. NEAU-D428]|nr:hypothetical protein [Microbispora sitophila]
MRERRAAELAVPVPQLFGEIKELGYSRSLNLLYRYITQGRAEGDRPVVTPRRLARLLLTRPGRLREADTTLLQELVVRAPELAELARLVRAFAELLAPVAGNDAKLAAWLTDARAADRPHLHGFANGLELDREAVTPASPCPITTAEPKASTRERRESCGRCTAGPGSTSCATFLLH